MANDRLILVDKNSTRAFVLATWSPSFGWEGPDLRTLAEFLDEVAGTEQDGKFCVVRESADAPLYVYIGTDPLRIDVAEARLSLGER